MGQDGAWLDAMCDPPDTLRGEGEADGPSRYIVSLACERTRYI
jgi:hypothetical protein